MKVASSARCFEESREQPYTPLRPLDTSGIANRHRAKPEGLVVIWIFFLTPAKEIDSWQKRQKRQVGR